MKISKFFIALLGFVSLYSCSEDWGQKDEPAGNQTYPSREQVATYSFEYDEETAVLSDMDKTYVPDGKVCEVIKDDSLSSNVLHLDSGYVRIANPLNNVTLQDGAAITMWVNLSQEALDKAIFAFGYDDLDSTKFYFTPNAQLVYTKPGQLESLNLDENDPSTVKTGAVAADNRWHFLAVQIGDDGYQVYVDGKLRANETNQSPKYDTDFDYKTLVEHLNNAPYIYIGAGSDTAMVEARYDDITLFRNHMQEKDWNKSLNGGGSTPSQVYVNVGPDDCSAGWWSEFSDYFTIPVDGTFHTKFINHTSGANNWNNWLLVATTDADRNADGYSEYFVLRADAYGWGNGDYSGDNITSNFVWDGYTSYMEGAVVDMTVTRSGSTITMTTTTTTTDGTVYNYSYHQDNCGEGQPIRLFLTVEAAYLQLYPQETYIGYKYDSGSKLVGAADCSATWWSAFSDFYSCPDGDEVVFHFINNNTGTGANYNNWLIVCSNEALGGANYAEHFVLRSDAYGWGGALGTYNGDNITQSFDWTTYVADMHGADCYVRAKYDSGTVTIDAKQKTAEGVVMPAYSYYQAATGELGFFLTAELASLDLTSVGYYPYFDKIFETAE